MNPKETTEYLMSEINQLKEERDSAKRTAQFNSDEFFRIRDEWIRLRAAAIMFLEAEAKLKNSQKLEDLMSRATRLDAARSVLWDVINDKDLTKQS